MGSRPLGRIDLGAGSSNADLGTDLATLEALDRPADLYDEFTIGSWVNHPLLNQSGTGNDSTFRDGTGVRATPVLEQLPAVRALLDKYFHNERLMMARVRDVREWSIIPHRDFLELDSDSSRYFRVLMTLQANDACMNSDESMVFRMRPGEVWFLDAAGVHSAINTSSRSRWSLCLDFDLGDEFDTSCIFRDSALVDPPVAPHRVQRPRPEFTADEMASAVATTVTRANVKEIAFGLGKVHFSADVPVDGSWDWLVEGCRLTGDSDLIDIAERAREFYLGSRKLTERFTFAA